MKEFFPSNLKTEIGKPDFLKSRSQRVTLYGQTSSWTDVNTGIPQGSTLGPLLFLIYINHLRNDFFLQVAKFLLMTLTVHNIRKFPSDLNKDSITVNKWPLSMEKNF